MQIIDKMEIDKDDVLTNEDCWKKLEEADRESDIGLDELRFQNILIIKLLLEIRNKLNGDNK